jgi:23S rRNA (uracil1939-C5)-methyltransferase
VAHEVDVDITSIAAGGDGVGRVDGVVVFTPRTAPGDRARVRAVTARGGRLARGTLLALLRASETRVVPLCPHFTRDRCGGCQLQHIQYGAQLQAKSGIVRDALAHIARRSVSAVPVQPSLSEWRYRRKLTLALRHSDSGWIAGLHRFDKPDEIFELEDCLITQTTVIDAWRSVMQAAALLPEGADRGSVRTTDAGLAFVIEGGDRWPTAARFAAAVPALTEIWWVPTGGRRRRMTDHADAHERTSGELSRGERTGASFVQVNADMSAALHSEVLARVLAYNPTTVIDAYAGTGATAIPLALRGVRVAAIESDQDAARHCASRMPASSRAIAATVEDALAAQLPADVLLLNPPRQGVAAAVTSLLVAAPPAARPRAIIYVSCDPATLARDVGRLHGWRIAALVAFDMFPQTAHVETICELVPAGEASA